ncbi:hypothetical protein [Luteitalea sp.]|uniref:hypothetical protein n=1 Tax=Luteitalea sp. TaxID=2004800 RepID=UPI0025BA4377|nr:hypothetical protein [Luteitalea sp.]
MSTNCLSPCVKSSIAILLAVAGVIAGAARVTTQAPASLPSLTVATTAGLPQTTDALVRAGAWVMVVSPGSCPPCGALFTTLDTAVPSSEMSRVVIALSGGTPAQVLAVQPRHVHLGRAEWVLDPSRLLLPALGVSGSPLLVGLRDDRIHWMRSAAGMSEAQLRAVLSSWIR